MCSVLPFFDSNEKLLSLMSESNNFDSVIFCFDYRRYKFTKSELGIIHPSDLLLRNQGLLSLLNPVWSYHLYFLDERHTYSIDSLCGKILRYQGSYPGEDECHVFIDRHKHHLTLLYMLCGELTAIHRQIRDGVLCIKRKEIPEGYRRSSWAEINRLLSVKKRTFRGDCNRLNNSRI